MSPRRTVVEILRERHVVGVEAGRAVDRVHRPGGRRAARRALALLDLRVLGCSARWFCFAPDKMCGMDATSSLTRREGNATVFVVVNHSKVESVSACRRRGWSRLRGGRGPAARGAVDLRPLRRRITTGLPAPRSRRQYRERLLQDEPKFLGIESSPVFVRLEGNGVAEQFIRPLKRQLLWMRTFDAVEELGVALPKCSKTATTGSGSASATPSAVQAPSEDGMSSPRREIEPDNSPTIYDLSGGYPLSHGDLSDAVTFDPVSRNQPVTFSTPAAGEAGVSASSRGSFVRCSNTV